ncbi:MAG: tetratricopeptide repeat protein [Pseudohongiella sp.]|nr:tetratricopeptide repeat protein [Pseudohongiella sp.]
MTKLNHGFHAASIFVICIIIATLVSCSASDSVPSRGLKSAQYSQPTIVFPECSVATNSPSLSAYCLFNSAVLLQQEGYSKQAKQEFIEVLSIDNTRPEVYLYLGDIYFGENDLNQAEQMYLAAVALDPENPVPFRNLGVIYDNTGEFEKAIDFYLESIKLSPQNSQSHYNLGLVYSRIPNQLEKAIAELKKSTELDPSISKVHYDLGQLYEYLNQSALAIESYQRALDLGYLEAAEKLQ